MLPIMLKHADDEHWRIQLFFLEGMGGGQTGGTCSDIREGDSPVHLETSFSRMRVGATKENSFK